MTIIASDIPQDVWDAAGTALFGDMTLAQLDNLSRKDRDHYWRCAAAILAERQACIAAIKACKDLDGSTCERYDHGYTEAHTDALAAIRHRGLT